MPKASSKKESLDIVQLNQGGLSLCIKGISPMIFNAMSFKAKTSLLFPEVTGRKTRAERAQSLKHQPLDEFRDSVYAHEDDNHPTRLYFPAGGFKKSMMQAALDVPGAKKAEIGRLLWVPGETVDIFGIPEVLMSVVRSADINKTPDIRTRAILPQCACRVSIRYVRPKLADTAVGNLLAAAGVLCGIGDGRQEKGSLNFGQFEICAEDDPEFVALTENAGRKQQDAALGNPALHDRETEKLFTWFYEELKKYGEERASKPIKAKREKAEELA